MSVSTTNKVNVASLVKDYCRSLSDEDIRWLYTLLDQRLGGDLGAAVSFIEKNNDINRWLGAACNAVEFYEMIDKIGSGIAFELRRRGDQKSK